MPVDGGDLRAPFLGAQGARLQALLHQARGAEADAEASFKEAVGRFREIEVPFWLGVTLAEYGGWLTERNRADQATSLLDEAGQIFERLSAKPWLERLARAPQERSASA